MHQLRKTVYDSNCSEFLAGRCGSVVVKERY